MTVKIILLLAGLGIVSYALYKLANGTAVVGAAGSAAGNVDDASGVTVNAGEQVPSTWPGNSGDAIWQCCYAIAFAEGYNVAGSNPNRLNNPGDISDGASQFGSEQHSGSSVTHFPDAATGWQWLYDKISNIVSGNSGVYSPDDSWQAIAQKWAGDWSNWVRNVTTYLGVSPSDRMGDFFGV